MTERAFNKIADGLKEALAVVQRCEPPLEWRERDGWHWVQADGMPAECWRWTASALYWQNTTAMTVRTATAYGWTYLAPVTPHSTVAALVEALEEIERCGFYGASDIARAALVLYRGETT